MASFVTVKSPLSLSLRGAVKVVIPGKKLLLPPQSDIDFFKRSKFMIESVATNERTTGRGTRSLHLGINISCEFGMPPFVSFAIGVEPPLSRPPPDALPAVVVVP